MSDLSKIGMTGDSEGISVENTVADGPRDQTISGDVPGFTFGSVLNNVEASNGLSTFGSAAHPTSVPNISIGMFGDQPATTIFGGFGASSASASPTNPIHSNPFAFGASVPTTGAGRTGGPPAASANAGGFSFGGSNSFTFGAPMPEEIKVVGPRGQAADGSPDMTAASSTATAGTSSAMSVSAAADGGPRKKIKATIRGATSSGTTSDIFEGFSFETSEQAPQCALCVVSQVDANNAFLKAVEDRNLEAAAAVVGQVNVNVIGKDDNTALFVAADKGHASIVEWLLTLDANVNIGLVSTIIWISM